MHTTRPIIVSILCIFFLFTLHSYASSLSKPKLIKDAKLAYPKARSFRESSGFVDVIYMIDSSGKTFEANILSSTHPALNKNAIKAILKMRYEPLDLKGENSSYRERKSLYFQNPNLRFANTPFMNRWQRKVKALLDDPSPDQSRIRRELDRAKGKNAQHNAKASHFISMGMVTQQLLEFEYAQKFGNPSDQIDALEPAASYLSIILNDKDFSDAHRRVFTNIYSNLFILYVNSLRYADSLYAYQQLNSLEANTTRFDSSFEQINSLKLDERAIESELTINENGNANYNLLKNHLSISKVPAGLKQLKLRCEKHYENTNLSSTYTVSFPEKWGQCMAEFIGDAGTSFSITQY